MPEGILRNIQGTDEIREKKTERRVGWVKEIEGAGEIGNMYINMCVCFHTYMHTYISM